MSPEEERAAFERRQLRRNPALNTNPPTSSGQSAQVSSDPPQEATKSSHNGRTFYRTTPRSASSLTQHNRVHKTPPTMPLNPIVAITTRNSNSVQVI